jgi:hypothetical protein
MRPLTVNTSDLEISRARESLLGFFGSLDAKRPDAWRQFGYRTDLTFDHFLTAYERGGAGHGAVHRIVDKCWQERPRIKAPGQDEATPWEESVKALLTSINGWQKLRDFDRRNLIGRYAGLIYRVADGLALREPLVRGQKLVDLVPVYENQLKVVAWNSDTNSPDFGAPTMYQYRMRPPQTSDTQGRPDQWVDVHPSRVQILAEGSVGDLFDGVPLLKAGFNALTDLEKISGGSAEGFLKNSARAVTINFAPEASPQVITQNPDGSAGTRSVREVIGEQVDNLNRNIDSAIVTQGATASTLQTTMTDPGPAFEVAANIFSASVQIPMTILFGAQTGRLASDQDQADMVARCKSRQVNELTPMLEQLVRRLQAAGLIAPGEFVVEWPPLDTPGDDAKAGLLDKMTSAMQKAFQSGLAEPLFDANELRRVLNFEPRADDGMPAEGEPAAGGEPTAAPPRLSAV